MSSEYERDMESKSVSLPKHIVQSFQIFLEKTSSAPFTLEKVSFDIKSESFDPDGTQHITVKPVSFTSCQEIREKGFYMLRSPSTNKTYLIELEDPHYYDEPVHFIGITRVSDPNLSEDKGKWAKEAKTERIRPIFQNQSYSVTSAMGFLLTDSEKASVIIYGQEPNLKAFYESLKG